MTIETSLLSPPPEHLVAALAVAVMATACHADPNQVASPDAADTTDAADATPYTPQFHPLDSDGHVLRDALGRTVILRGYNVKATGIFDVTPDNGDPVREAIPTLDDTDFALMQRSGVNVLRLPVNWSAFEPAQGNYQDAYLDAVAAFLDRVRPYGFFVLLDFHEDGWSKDLCEDGAPAWATVVTVSGDAGLPDADCHASPAALSAHSNFFDQNVNDLQGTFAKTYQRFAARFVDDDTVLGYEIFNEPIASDALVDAFSIKLATAIRAVDPRHLILWEPSALRNLLDEAYVSSTPFPVPGCVYAVHIYTARSDATWPDRLATSIQGAREEADGWGEPLFVTEHGADPVPDGLTWVDEALDQFDTAQASSIDWIWNPGVVTRDDAGGVDYVFDGGVYAHLTRPYAMTIGGDVDATAWDGTQLTISFHVHAGVPTTHDIYWNRGTASVTCDGAVVPNVTLDANRQVLSLGCGDGVAAGDGVAEHVIVVAPAS